jgi:hypothetical protein
MWAVNPGFPAWDKLALVLTSQFDTLVKCSIVAFLKYLSNWNDISYKPVQPYELLRERNIDKSAM